MKKLFTILSAVLLTAIAFAQSPEKMSYQAVVRDASDNLVTNQDIGMQISILQGSATGTAIYVETQIPTTNVNGLVSIEIGGTNATVVLGSFATIDWANGLYFIKTETDPTGGTNYTITGTSQLLSVPYALHAKTAESLAGALNETDPVYSGSQAANITSTDITNLNNLSGINTGDQDLSSLASQSALVDTASVIRTNISGFISTEADPVYSGSQAANIISTDITNLGNLSGTNTGDQDLGSLASQSALIDTASAIRTDISGFVSSETDPVYSVSQAANIISTDITNFSNLSGTNTGDQDLSSLASQSALVDTASAIRTNISGFISTEADPVYSGSQAANIISTDITNLGNLSGTNTGDQDLGSLASQSALVDTASAIRTDISGFISTEADPVYSASQAENITSTDITNLDNLSGINTGDQDLSSLASQSALVDTASAIRADIPDVSGFISTETDPVYSGSQAANITSTDITNLDNLSGINTGDQTLATILAENTSAGNKKITDVVDPTDAQDAATKAYIDQMKAEIYTQIAGGKVTDYDGNTYNTVKIGNQTWMAENLKTTKLNEGTDIPLVTDNTAWGNLATPGYCWYNNDSATYSNTYGALYNWYSVETTNLCPTGWHVPNDVEWTTLSDYLGGTSVAGGKLKETGTTHWKSPNTDATNETGFTALPGGARSDLGVFQYIENYCFLWSSTEFSATDAWYWYMNYSSIQIFHNKYHKQLGHPVRCIKD